MPRVSVTVTASPILNGLFGTILTVVDPSLKPKTLVCLPLIEPFIHTVLLVTVEALMLASKLTDTTESGATFNAFRAGLKATTEGTVRMKPEFIVRVALA
jgi:hypothetical protein